MTNADIITYIKAETQKGVDRKSITKALLSNSWNAQDIDESFRIINSNSDSSNNFNQKNNLTDIKKSLWTKGISRTNNVFLVLYLILVFGVDLLILISSPSLAPFWYMMLGVFAVYAIFYFFENFFLKQRFQDTQSSLDKYISTIIVLRNIVVLLNFIPFIQLLGLAIISGFLSIFSFGLSRGLGLGGYGVIGFVGPLLMCIYVILIIMRFSQTKRS